MEETELIRVTFQGTEMFFRLGGALIKDALKFIKFFITVVPQYNRWKINRDTEKMKNEMTKAEYDIIKNRQKIHEGGVQYEAFIKAFGSEERTILNIADTSADRFYDLAKSHRLTYTLLPDLNLADGVFQIMVPSSQSDIFKVIIDRLTEEELRKNGERVETLKEEIRLMERESAEAEETLAELKKEGKTDTEEYKSAEEKIKETETAILEKETEMELLMGTVSGEITSEEYMATNEFAFNHQEMFNAMMEKGVELHADRLREGILKVTKEQDKPLRYAQTDKAITDVTSRRDILDKDRSIILCSPESPENHIEVTLATSEYEDRTYICTKYDVYADGIKQRCDEFSHGEFTHYSDIKAENSGEVGKEHWENMKKEICAKGKLGESVLVFDSTEEYQKYIEGLKNGKNTVYFANPNVAEIGVKMEKGTDGFVCTVMRNGADTGIKHKISMNAKGGEVLPFVKTVEKEIRKVSDVNENEWVKLNGQDRYLQFRELIQSNSPSSSIEAEKEIEKKIPEAKEQLISEGRKQAELEKTLIEIPKKNLLILPEEMGFNYVMYSDNMKYVAELPHYKVNEGTDDRMVLVLEKDEGIDFKQRRTEGKAGSIDSQKSLSDFLSENIRTGISDIEKSREKRMPVTPVEKRR